MKKLILSFALLGLLAGDARAGLVLATEYSPGTPLIMNAGTTSGPMLVNVVSDNPPNDVMAAWNFQLMIVPDVRRDRHADVPGSREPGRRPSRPTTSSAVTASASRSLNGRSTLSANDFFDPNVGPGVPVPGAPGANLLQMDFLASSNASGLFGIYAMEGAALTQWTDSNLNTVFFTNVPDGTGLVQIGEILISTQSVPEPSSLGLLGLAVATLAGWRCWSKPRHCRLAKKQAGKNFLIFQLAIVRGSPDPRRERDRGLPTGAFGRPGGRSGDLATTSDPQL